MNTSITIILRVLIGLLLLLKSTGYVVAAIDIPVDANYLDLKRNSLLFTDANNQYTNLSSLLANNINFIPLSDKPLGASNARHWIKIDLHNPDNKPHNWLLQLGLPSLPYLHAYWYKQGQISTITELTADSKYAERPIDGPLLFIPISFAANETKTLYLHYQSVVDVPLELKLFSPSNFEHYNLQENSINNLLLGFMLAFLCIVSVNWMLSRNLTYMYYTALVLCMTLVIGDMSGYNFKYLWPEHGSWSLLAPLIIMNATYSFYLLFIREFFSLKNNNVRLYQAYTGFILLNVSLLIFIIVFNIIEALIIFGIILIPLLIFTSIWAIKRQLKSAKVFSLSIFSHVFFVNVLFIAAIAGFNFFPNIHLMIYAKLGYVLEVLFFTIAISIQNRQLRINYTKSLQNRLAEAETLALVEKEKSQLLAETQNKILQFATTTHDLAQPLSSVRMALEAMPQEVGQHIKQHIDKTVAYAEQLLRTIIRDAKADFVEQKTNILLSDIFEQAIAHHSLQAKEKGIELSYFHSQRRVLVSQQSLLRILDNLLANAIRYTTTGRVFLGVRRKENGLQIQVMDTGKGININTLERLSQPFEQSGHLEAEKNGYGLGLYIVKVLCQKSGYQLSINSQQGRGSCFCISIKNTHI